MEESPIFILCWPPPYQSPNWNERCSYCVDHRYLSSLELRQRLDGELFVQTVRAMKNVSSALSEYLNYARDLTSGLPTSNFELMEQSIILFNSYMAEDFKLAFQWVYIKWVITIQSWFLPRLLTQWAYYCGKYASIFRDISNYSRDYDYAYKWNHEARIALVIVSSFPL